MEAEVRVPAWLGFGERSLAVLKIAAFSLGGRNK
jgi:hypothetical protein